MTLKDWNRRIPSVSTAELEKLASQFEMYAEMNIDVLPEDDKARHCVGVCAGQLRALISKATNGRGNERE